MDDSAEGEVVLQFLWAHVELLTYLSRLCPIPLESFVCLCALLDRTAVVEVGVLLAVIATCLFVIRHPECHSHIREAFSLLPRAIRSIRQKFYLSIIKNASVWSPLDEVARLPAVNYKARELIAKLLNHYRRAHADADNKDCPKQSNDANCVQKSETAEWGKNDSMTEAFAMQGHRAHMEDRFCMLAEPKRDLYLYGVFDGHGGRAAADYTEKQLFPAILERIRQSTDEIDIASMQDILRQEILRVDEAFIKESKKKRDYSGTTCLVAVILGDTLIVANVGDSRGVMATDKGRAVPLSFDHKPQQTKEHKRIQDAGGFISFNGVWRVAGILATSRAIGDHPLKDRNLVTAEPDILTFNLTQQQGSFIVLASDGLWDIFSNEEAIAFVRQRSSLAGAGKELAKRAFEKGSQDNITVLVIDLSKYPLLQKILSKKKDEQNRVAKLQAQSMLAAARERADERAATAAKSATLSVIAGGTLADCPSGPSTISE
ncbi:protein phosphatase 1L-like isoform X1 [Varroa jacobsoni]|uniref:protein phosphatase 1L-like isoform X1 n=1 Tax=Varroa jacobsoni TaxID=62625 RepID=UPI000BF2F47B|nr:protein phosphatase 1L-like isoform X1 [Varroa jacobsoni]